MFSSLLICWCFTFKRAEHSWRVFLESTVRLSPFYSSSFYSFCFTRELASLEIQFRLVQAARPRGVGRDEGPASLPVLITKRQGACRQISGNGWGSNAGHAWWWDLAWCVCVHAPPPPCICACVCKFNHLWQNRKLEKNISFKWLLNCSQLEWPQNPQLTALIFTTGTYNSTEALNYVEITSD